MGYVSCDWYYENILGDNCDNNCEKCFADKDIYICKKDFEVVGEFFVKFVIEKGSWWELIFLNQDHALLRRNLNNREIYLKRDLFNEYFDSLIIERQGTENE